jgi:ribosome modulation factor
VSGTQEPLQSNVPAETILHYTHELTRTKRRVDEATSAHRLTVKRAKADGVPTDAILESIAWARLEPEVRRQKMVDRVRVESARYPQSGEILTDLLGRLDTRVSEKMRFTDTLFDAEQKGYQAGKFAVPVDDCPYDPGTEHAQTWRHFWGQGQAANAAQLGEHAKQANASREKPAKVADLPMRGLVPSVKRSRTARKAAAAAPTGRRKRRAPNGTEAPPPAA